MNNQLITNNPETNFYQELKGAFNECEGFCFSVAFINLSGLQLLLDSLKELEDKNIPGKIITSTYLNFTEPKALRRLKEFSNIDLKIFEIEKNIGFHTKGYIFQNPNYSKIFIGSSNITQSALKSNQEWNVKIQQASFDEFEQSVTQEFNKLWKVSINADDEFLISYEEFYNQIRLKRTESPQFALRREFEPNLMQMTALANFRRLREQNQRKAIAIAATGTGKTIMAALDVKTYRPQRVLFIVHREQILQSARKAFAEMIPERASEMGLLTGNINQADKNFIFSTNLTMNNYLGKFPKDYFDYIVIDEAHHATSTSWQNVINYFEPRFLLGMTATPERSDSGDIFNFFDNNIAVEVRLRSALEDNLVIPFHYFGISDETVDLHDVKLSEIDKIARLLKINRRVDFIIEKMNFYGYDGAKRKSIGFCVTQDHASFMAEEFNKRGITAVALNSNNSIEERKKCVARLEDDNDTLEFIFTVDIFNEGVDIPTINSILMLRPTSSPIVFIQQLGRGLRKTETKEYLTVLDFIGNHNKTFLIAMALCGARAYDKDSLKKAVASDFSDIPGCTNIQLDKISKERILRQIETTNFNAIKFLKEEYSEFKSQNLNKIPTLVDFVKFDGAPNPLKFINYSYSYTEFVAKVDDFASKYKDLLLDKAFIKLIRQLSNELPLKRPYEFALLEHLLENQSVSLEKAGVIVKKYIEGSDKNALRHSFQYLSGAFDDSTDKKLKLPILQFDGTTIIRLESFDQLLGNQKTKKHITDIIRYGLLRYEEEFGDENYGAPFFKLYQSYNGRNMALLSNYDKMHSAFRGSGLLSHDNDRFLIVELHKDEGIEERIKYKDKFISPSVFQWQSPNNTSQDSERGKDLIHNKQRAINLHLFVRKIKEIDGIIQPFIYLGKADCIEKDGEKPITLQLKLENKIPPALYDELNSPIIVP